MAFWGKKKQHSNGWRFRGKLYNNAYNPNHVLWPIILFPIYTFPKCVHYSPKDIYYIYTGMFIIALLLESVSRENIGKK